MPRGATSSTDVTLDTTAAALSGVLVGDTVALVTGCSTGIGRASALALHRAGRPVMVNLAEMLAKKDPELAEAYEL